MEKQIRVLGLDVSKSSVSACLLTEKPVNPRQFYYSYEFKKLNADISGIKAMLDFKPDIAIIEPTGTNYSKLWLTQLARAGVEVRLVGHKELRRYRENHLDLPDKDDDADALALACYLFDYTENRRRFVQIRDSTISQIRETILRLSHLNRIQSPVINRIRQDLAWQFPEISLVKSVRGSSGKVPLLWGWLANERSSTRYDKLYQNTCGIGINDSVRYHAQRICSLQREEYELEIKLDSLLATPKFKNYCDVFTIFGFGSRLQAMLLSQIYPIESYFGDDGKPEITFQRGRKSGKPTKRYLSLRRFQKALGVAPTQESSGDSKKTKVTGGSDLCRKALWQWVFTRIEPRRSRLKNDIGQVLGEFLDAEKLAGKPIRLVRSRVSAKAIKLLFKELVKAVT